MCVCFTRWSCIIDTSNRIPYTNTFKSILWQFSNFQIKMRTLSFIIKYNLTSDSVLSFLRKENKKIYWLNLLMSKKLWLFGLQVSYNWQYDGHAATALDVYNLSLLPQFLHCYQVHEQLLQISVRHLCWCCWCILCF